MYKTYGCGTRVYKIYKRELDNKRKIETNFTTKQFAYKI